MSNEETLWPTNETVGMKPLGTTVADQTPINKPPQILSTETQKPVGMVTPSFNVAKKCTGEEVQQPYSKLTNYINGEVEFDLTPSENVKKKSTFKEHNQVSFLIFSGLYMSSLKIIKSNYIYVYMLR